QDRELVEPLRQRGLEARRCAELLTEVADLGTAQQHVERTRYPAARSGEQMLDHRLLRLRHLVVRERLETVAAKLNGSRVGTAGGGSLSDKGSDQRERTAADD